MKLSKKQVDRGLKNSLKHGFTNHVRQGIKDNYMIPLALAVGAGNEMIGLIKALPELVGMLSQLFSSKFIKKTNSKKRASLVTALFNRLFLLPIIFVPFFYDGGIWIILLFLSLYAIFSEIGSTAWTTWMADLVPERIRGRFFGTRNMFNNLASFLATLSAGWFLGWIDNIQGFAVIFAISFVFGMISYFYMKRVPDTDPPKSHKHFHFSFPHFLRGIREHKNYSNFVIFRMLMHLAVGMASPFIIVYMLKTIEIGYFWFAAVTAGFILTSVVSQRYWGVISDRYGDVLVLRICSILTPLGILPFIFVTNGPQAMLVQIFSGFVFAGFSLASFNYLLDVVPKNESPSFVANYRFLSKAGLFVGPLVGGLLAAYFTGFSLFTLVGIQLLFLLSFFLRIIFVGAFMPRFNEVRVNKKNVHLKNMFFNVLVVFPIESTLRELKHVIHYLHTRR